MNRPYLSCIYYLVSRLFSFFSAAMYLQKLSSQFSLMLISLLLLNKAKYHFAVSLCIFVRAIYSAPWSHYVDLIFAHYLYRASCPASIHRTFAPILYHLFSCHKVLYIAKCKKFESSIYALHDALLFSAQVIHRILLNRVHIITMTIIYCLCLSHIHSHSIHN